MTVFHPYIMVVGCKRYLCHRILYEDGRMRFMVVMDNLTLVVDEILHRQCRRQYLMTGTM